MGTHLESTLHRRNPGGCSSPVTPSVCLSDSVLLCPSPCCLFPLYLCLSHLYTYLFISSSFCSSSVFVFLFPIYTSLSIPSPICFFLFLFLFQLFSFSLSVSYSSPFSSLSSMSFFFSLSLSISSSPIFLLSFFYVSVGPDRLDLSDRLTDNLSICLSVCPAVRLAGAVLQHSRPSRLCGCTRIALLEILYLARLKNNRSDQPQTQTTRSGPVRSDTVAC